MTVRDRGRSGSSRARRTMTAFVLLVFLLFCAAVAYVMETSMSVKIENAGVQLTSHTNTRNTAQVFMNGRWYAERNMETLLVIGLDQYGDMTSMESSHGGTQADFLVLFVRDKDTGRNAAIHINRDSMTDVMTYGVTGEATGTRRAQLALAYYYGNGHAEGSNNVVAAVEHLLYGIEINHYITVTMDAVPLLNDWAGGVAIEVLDDFSDIDPMLAQGEILRLDGQQALTYVRTRKGLEDSTNLSRMERQRQYASEWVKHAQNKLDDKQAVADLMLQLEGYYQSNCTAEDLAAYADNLNMDSAIPVYEISGQAVEGEEYMEFHVDEEALQRLVLELFWTPVY